MLDKCVWIDDLYKSITILHTRTHLTSLYEKKNTPKIEQCLCNVSLRFYDLCVVKLTVVTSARQNLLLVVFLSCGRGDFRLSSRLPLTGEVGGAFTVCYHIKVKAQKLAVENRTDEIQRC